MLRQLILPIVVATLSLAACAAPTTQPPAATPSLADPPTVEPSTSSGDDIRIYSIIPDQTKASYSVGEIFLNQNNQFNVAVGVTNAVSGDIHLNFTHPEQSTVGPITVDISTLKSDSRRRDDAIRRDWLESSKFPIATFTPTKISGLPGDYKDGDEITLEVVGDLTIRDTTRSTTFSVKATLKDEKLTGTATTTILMSDFNFEAPDIADILKAENEARLELKFVALPTS